jgi:hypothetical protein
MVARVHRRVRLEARTDTVVVPRTVTIRVGGLLAWSLGSTPSSILRTGLLLVCCLFLTKPVESL